MGLAWCRYGYDYECEGVSDPLAWTCPMKLVPFRGVNCSDAAGRQVAYQYIAQRLGSGKTSTGRRYEDYMGAPFYNYVDEASGAVHQVSGIRHSLLPASPIPVCSQQFPICHY